MKWANNFSTVRISAEDHPQKDDQGGIIPTNPERAKKADLITLPDGVDGTNCGNCNFFDSNEKGTHCDHPKVKMPVNSRNCCAFWDSTGTKRHF